MQRPRKKPLKRGGETLNPKGGSEAHPFRRLGPYMSYVSALYVFYMSEERNGTPLCARALYVCLLLCLIYILLAASAIAPLQRIHWFSASILKVVNPGSIDA